MPSFRNGSLHLGRVLGINVFVHWTWFALVYFFVVYAGAEWLMGLLSYIALFGIVLLHEYGHALACRSVGGRANTIVLWPLGGIAFVEPPPRPGAVLWSIVAGPLVNVVLLPILFGLWWGLRALPGTPWMETLTGFVYALNVINAILLAFNLLPIYPLDGGQILQALLWFVVGRAKSLKIVSMIGFIAAGVFIVGFFMYGWGSGNWMLLVVALFIAWQAWRGSMAANILARQEQMQQPWERGWKM